MTEIYKDKIYIQNFNIHNEICEYEPPTGRFTEISRLALGKSVIRYGYYTKVKEGLIGIFASENGPILFYNSKRFLLGKADFELELSQGEIMNKFIFKWDGKEIINIFCSKPKDLNINPYADEQFMDFFTWLCEGPKGKEFIETFTLKGKLIGQVMY